jgi:hypothetical protein
MLAAKTAQVSGDKTTALALAQAASGFTRQSRCMLLASVEIEAGDITEDRLKHHFKAIAGHSYRPGRKAHHRSSTSITFSRMKFLSQPKYCLMPNEKAHA